MKKHKGGRIMEEREIDIDRERIHRETERKEEID